MKYSHIMYFLILCVVIFFTTAAGGEETDIRTFTIANGTEPETLDPHLMSGVPEHRIAMGIYEGLVTVDPETALAVPGVAESWTVSDDGTVYTFTLRETNWSDGTPITAQDFVASWRRVLDPETAAPYAWFPSMFLKGAEAYNAGEADADSLQVRALDDRTFQFETIGPLPYVINALSHYTFGVVPTHAIEKHGAAWVQPENFVGNGPYLISDWETQRQVSLEPNEHYWDQSKANVGKIVFLPVEEQTVMYNMFLNEEINWSTDYPDAQIEEIRLRGDHHSEPYLGTYYYIFQTEHGPLQDARVRKALSMAIDRQLLIETVIRGGQSPAVTMVPPMAGYTAIAGLEENVQKAQALLAEAGYPNGSGFPKLEILYNTSENHKSIGEFIQQQWFDNLGVDVDLTNQEWGVYLNTRRKGDFHIARAGWIGDYPDPNTFLDMFVSGGAMNGGRYANSAYDELIRKASSLPDGPERANVLADAERTLVEEDTAIMPIYYYMSKNLINVGTWRGWYNNVMDYHPVGAVN